MGQWSGNPFIFKTANKFETALCQISLKRYSVTTYMQWRRRRQQKLSKDSVMATQWRKTF